MLGKDPVAASDVAEVVVVVGVVVICREVVVGIVVVVGVVMVVSMEKAIVATPMFPARSTATMVRL